MDIPALIATIGTSVLGVLGFVFGLRQKDKRKAAEKALEKTVATDKRQQEATKIAVKEVMDDKKKYEERKKEEMPDKVTNPSSVDERLARLRK